MATLSVHSFGRVCVATCGLSLAAVCGLCAAVASSVVEHRLQDVWASAVVVCGLMALRGL